MYNKYASLMIDSVMTTTISIGITCIRHLKGTYVLKEENLNKLFQLSKLLITLMKVKYPAILSQKMFNISIHD